MARFATGVTVVTFDAGGEHGGLTANAFMSVSLDPMLVLVSIRKASRFCTHVRKGDHYGVSLLTGEQREICNKYAGRPFQGSILLEEMDGIQVVAGSLAQLVAQVVDIHEVGDHLLYIGQVRTLAIASGSDPLIYFSGEFGDFRSRTGDERQSLRLFWPDMAVE
ncbi:hypothetical protein AXW67_37520 [Bradyrhizobium neotropicale]|uniref:Flavin reductase like domain-containing protein n=2 Tax=Bradyrhizobium neotropicale TaxID=1497615 RepID=A0A176ZER4_9BRAD|nr:hypothetical protein AXW67_37520 [Bradyrhizobium neotropicale]